MLLSLMGMAKMRNAMMVTMMCDVKPHLGPLLWQVLLGSGKQDQTGENHEEGVKLGSSYCTAYPRALREQSLADLHLVKCSIPLVIRKAAHLQAERLHMGGGCADIALC